MSKESQDKYAVKVLKTNKDELFQPQCCESGVLPKLPFSCQAIGRSGSGKTMAIFNMLSNENMLKDAFDYVYIWAGVKVDPEMVEVLDLPDEQVKNKWEESDVEKLIDKLEKSVEKNGIKNTPSVLFIFDDILGRPKFLKSKTMTKLFTLNRHLNLSVIIMSQYFKKLSPVIRTNASYTLFFPASSAEVDKLAEEMCPANMTKNEFKEIVEYATNEEYQFLGINSKAKCGEQLRKGFGKIIHTNKNCERSKKDKEKLPPIDEEEEEEEDFSF